jgi:thiol reductant ABC exporter CydC subunit
VPRRNLLSEALGAERAALVRSLAAGAAVSLSTVGLAGTSAWLIVRAAERPAVLSLTVPMGLVQLFALAKAAGRYLERTTTHRAALGAMGRVRWRVAERVEPLLPAGLGPSPGAAVDLVLNDVERVQDLLTAVAAPLVAALVAGLVSVVVLGAVAPAAGLVLALGLAISGVGAPALAARAGRRSEEELATLSERTRRAVALVARAGDELVTTGATGWVLDTVAELEHRVDRVRRRRAWRAGAVAATASLASGATLVALVVVTAHALRAGQMGRTLVAVPALVAIAALELTGSLTPAMTGLRGDVLAARRLDALGDLNAPVTEPAVVRHDVARADRVSAQGLAQRFGEHRVLEGVDLVLAPGDVVAVNGPSAVGKSTLARALARLIDPSEGTLTLGGANYRELASSQVRERVGLVDDEPHVFAASLAANLRIARPDADEADLLAALRAAGLGPLLASLPEGLATVLGGTAVGLSGGERRRLGVARELLTGRPIAVLDEPTEGLDATGAAALLAELVRRYRGGALLIVSHRPGDRAVATRVLELASPPARP